MKFDSAFLQNLAPSAQRSLFIGMIGISIAVLVYMFGVKPSQATIAADQAAINSLQDEQTRVSRDLASFGKVKEHLDALTLEKKRFEDEGLIEPLLGAYDMRAKTLLDPLADAAELTIEAYQEMPVRALPVPDPQPRSASERPLYGRQPIECTAHGSYAQIVSFLLAVERDFPYVALSGLHITAQQTPDIQRAIMTFEWPCRRIITADPVIPAPKK